MNPVSTPDPFSQSESLTKLNLGCGKKRIEGAINLDLVASVGPEVTHDLNQRPSPFPDARFTEVFAHDIIEHCVDVIRYYGRDSSSVPRRSYREDYSASLFLAERLYRSNSSALLRLAEF